MAQTEVTQAAGMTVAKYHLRENGESFYSARYSPDGKFLALTLGSGALRILQGSDNTILQRSKLGQGYDDVPSCSVRFRPQCEFTEENVYELVTASSAGAIFGFTLDSTSSEEMYLDRSWRMVEENNDTLCADYSPDGLALASVGADRAVRVYDPNKRKLVATMTQGHDENGHTRPAHTNRIFSCRFTTPTTLVTAGWENPVQIWDLRTGKSERQIGGPAVGGDTVDVLPGTQHIIIGSHRPERQIQVFDFLGCREMKDESARLSAPLERSPVSAMRFNAEANTLWVATGKPDQVLALDFDSGAVRGKAAAPNIVFALEPSPVAKNRCMVAGAKELLWQVELDA
jgi:hypothetical protein